MATTAQRQADVRGARRWRSSPDWPPPLLGSGLVGEEHNYRRDRVGVVPVDLDPAAARRPDGAGAAVLPGARADRDGAVLRCGRSPGWCTRSAHRSAICSGPTSSTAAATSRPRTIWWGRRRSAGVGDDEFVAPRECSWRRASSEADSHGQCNFRGFGGCHAEWISVLEVGAAGVVRPGVWGAPPRRAAQDPHGPR